MVLKGASKALGIFFMLAMLAGLAVGCATTKMGKDTYTSDRDAQAVYEMEWNLDPWR